MTGSDECTENINVAWRYKFKQTISLLWPPNCSNGASDPTWLPSVLVLQHFLKNEFS